MIRNDISAILVLIDSIFCDNRNNFYVHNIPGDIVSGTFADILDDMFALTGLEHFVHVFFGQSGSFVLGLRALMSGSLFPKIMLIYLFGGFLVGRRRIGRIAAVIVNSLDSRNS